MNSSPQDKAEEERPRVIEFEAVQGLFGFEDVRYYTFLEIGDGGPFKWLQATRGVKLAFVVVQPQLFWPSYSGEVIGVEANIMESLGATCASDLAPYIIVTVPDDPFAATGNFRAPILVNFKTKKLRQIILHNQEYPISCPLFPQLQRGGESAC